MQKSIEQPNQSSVNLNPFQVSKSSYTNSRVVSNCIRTLNQRISHMQKQNQDLVLTLSELQQESRNSAANSLRRQAYTQQELLSRLDSLSKELQNQNSRHQQLLFQTTRLFQSSKNIRLQPQNLKSTLKVSPIASSLEQQIYQIDLRIQSLEAQLRSTPNFHLHQKLLELERQNQNLYQALQKQEEFGAFICETNQNLLEFPHKRKHWRCHRSKKNKT